MMRRVAGLVPAAIDILRRDRPRISGDASAQRPWHFLYLAPEPHQHGSFRPMRAPVGV